MRIPLDSVRTVTDTVNHACKACDGTIPAGEKHELGQYTSRFTRQRFEYRFCMACVKADIPVNPQEAAQP